MLAVQIYILFKIRSFRHSTYIFVNVYCCQSLSVLSFLSTLAAWRLKGLASAKMTLKFTILKLDSWCAWLYWLYLALVHVYFYPTNIGNKLQKCRH